MASSSGDSSRAAHGGLGGRLAEGDDVFSCGRFRFREHGPAFVDSGGVADQLSEHAVAPAALIDAVLAARGV
jgi:hypothetical protein